MASRPKAELLNIVERIVKLYEVDKKSLDDITQILKSENIDISRSSIHRTIKKNKTLAEQYKKAMSQAEILIKAVQDSPNTDILETASTLFINHLFEFARSIDNINFDDPIQFSEVLSRITRAHVSLSKIRLDFRKGFNAAKEAILKELGQELKNQPEIMKKIVAIVQGIDDEKLSQKNK
jgi:predicted DNA-binding protein YlxM (UPF0122 family)